MHNTHPLRRALNHLRLYGFKSFVATFLEFVIIRTVNITIIRKIVRKLHSAIRDDIFTRFDNQSLFRNLLYRDVGVSPKSFSPKSFKDKDTFLLTDQQLDSSLQHKLGPVIKSLDGFSSDEIAKSVFCIYFLCDSDALPMLRKIKECGGIYIPHLSTSKTSYRFTNRIAYNAMRRTWAKSHRISHLHASVHENICEALWITRNVDGDYLDMGAYLGGSALIAISFLEELNATNTPHCQRSVWLLDTFDGFSYPEAYQSSDVVWAGSHRLFGKEKTMSYIEETLSDTYVQHYLVAMNICNDNIPSEIQQIAVANIDVDMYEATLSALLKISDLIVPSGIIICEDPTATPRTYGALLAMEEFLMSKKGADYRKIFKGSQYFLYKNP